MFIKKINLFLFLFFVLILGVACNSMLPSQNPATASPIIQTTLMERVSNLENQITLMENEIIRMQNDVGKNSQAIYYIDGYIKRVNNGKSDTEEDIAIEEIVERAGAGPVKPKTVPVAQHKEAV